MGTVITARYAGTCRACGGPFAYGDQISHEAGRVSHERCGQVPAGAMRWDEPAGCTSPRGWLHNDTAGGMCVGFYLDYGPDNCRSGHTTEIYPGGPVVIWCRPGRLCRDCQPGNILAARYPGGPSTELHESRYVETVAQAREYVTTGRVAAGQRRCRCNGCRFCDPCCCTTYRTA